ncbi:MAG TPA: DNA/RNA non-specific endonuclease [Bacteroidota bacterium]|mgnify:CR=1 FL=1|nr:DNA/RNA non-specific endonuclease [Bacteroidota bacterium]
MTVQKTGPLPRGGLVLSLAFLAGLLLAACSQESAPTQPTPQHISVLDTTGRIHIELGTPHDADSSDDFVMIRRQYAVSYNRLLNVPNWVSWNLNADWFGDVPRYEGNFITDTSLPEGFYRVKHSDYTNSGFHRGHMVRSEERTLTEEDNRSTFLMTNILPQAQRLNQEVWLDLEYWCEAKCKQENKELFIIAGGIFHEPHERLNSVVAVPDSCFKIVVVMERGQRLQHVSASTEVVAVVMPNSDDLDTSSWTIYKTSVDRIEQSTGYDFLDLVADEIEVQIERER